MLARVANSLYWTGRYIERSEHLARYLNVQYFSTLDAPMTLQKEVILTSILQMAGVKSITQEQQQNGQQQSLSTSFKEQDILIEVTFNPTNSNSIFSNVQNARENARSVRYLLSTGLWEAINQYYHFVKTYSVDFYKTRGLYDFTVNARKHCSIIRSYANSTLLNDDIWAFLKLGFHVERSAQIIRVLLNKIIDIHSLTNNKQEDPLAVYQWTTTLKILESFDMYRRVYRSVINQKEVLEFLLSHPTLPCSIAFSLSKVNEMLSCLTFAASPNSQLAFQAGKLANSFKYLEYEEIEGNLQEFLTSSLNKIYQLHELIEKEYFE
ncbi:MAG: alpha-E domain-containing protein [Chitinophagales bacterium]